MIINIYKNKKGFTLVELMISVAIFALMTTFLIAKYGNFNQTILLTNLAYDIALTIRNAQSYGLNVKSIPGSSDFSNPYGVYIEPGQQFIFFSDLDSDHVYDSGEIIGLPSVIRRTNLSIFSVCAQLPGVGQSCNPVDSLAISFKRPDPNAIIYGIGQSAGSGYGGYIYAEITLHASDGSIKKVIVRSTGEIAITS